MGHYEFFTRALKPGVHYVEVDPENLCDDLVSKVRGPIMALSGSLHCTASPDEQPAQYHQANLQVLTVSELHCVLQ